MATLYEGKTYLQTLISGLVADTDMNEAQTRFHIIDALIKECFGWGNELIEVENQEDRKFTDYELGKPRLVIWEAKREGKTFELPANHSNKIIQDIPSICELSPDARNAIEQAQEYCSKRGVQVAVVTNGHQIISFLATRSDGISPLSANALVFKSLTHLYENFNCAWQMLSFDGIKEHKLARFLVAGETGLPSKLSTRLTQYPRIRYPSELQATLKQLSEILINDVMDNSEVEEEFFKQCYCESGALSKYALLSKNILEARYASMFSETEPSPNVLPVKDSKKSDNFSPDVMSEALTKRPVVLIGDVGVGKTSFVKHLMYISAYNEFKEAIYIYIDLGSKASLTEDLRKYVLAEIENQLYEKYAVDINEVGFIKGAYASDISRFSKGLWGECKESDIKLYNEKLNMMLDTKISLKDQHVKTSINYLSKARQKQIIIALDNADQRDFQIQQETFIISQELAKDWNSMVFVSVRPQTFYKSKRSGALTAYPHKIFTISPPRTDIVISKRLQFALDMAEGKIPLDTFEHIKINVKNLAIFLSVLLDSLKTNKDLQEFLSNITGGNIRGVIDFVTNFIGSPNVDAEKIIDIKERTGSYTIPVHEFTKSALLGEYSHYSPDTSIAMNIFDVSTSDSREHFLSPIVLSYLIMDGSHKNKDGFCTTISLYEELQSIGFTTNQIESILRRTTNKKLIETSQRITFEEDESGLIGNMPASFRVTLIGAYHLKKWLGTFTYFDAMVFDTPIFNSTIRDKILVSLESFNISDRFDRAVLFKEYLLSCWANLPNKPIYFNFPDIIAEKSDTFIQVKKAIDSNKQSKDKI